MKNNPKKQLTNRMNYLLGHLGGVKKMIDKDAYCIDIIQQNLGVISAIHKVNEEILKNHLNSCVLGSAMSAKGRKKKNLIDELLSIYKNYRK